MTYSGSLFGSVFELFDPRALPIDMIKRLHFSFLICEMTTDAIVVNIKWWKVIKIWQPCIFYTKLNKTEIQSSVVSALSIILYNVLAKSSDHFYCLWFCVKLRLLSYFVHLLSFTTWPWPEVNFLPWPFKVILYMDRFAWTREIR